MNVNMMITALARMQGLLTATFGQPVSLTHIGGFAVCSAQIIEACMESKEATMSAAPPREPDETYVADPVVTEDGTG